MTLVIKDVLLLPVDGAQAEVKCDVVVADGRIAAIKEAGAARVEGARIIDGHDRLLMPGLVNAHTHSPTNVLGAPATASAIPRSCGETRRTRPAARPMKSGSLRCWAASSTCFAGRPR